MFLKGIMFKGETDLVITATYMHVGDESVQVTGFHDFADLVLSCLFRF